MMKHYIFLLLVIGASLGLYSCANDKPEEEVPTNTNTDAPKIDIGDIEVKEPVLVDSMTVDNDNPEVAITEEAIKQVEPAPKPKPKSKPAPTPALPEITFEKQTYDFGEIEKGKQVEHEFFFSNTGKEDLVIFEAKASCGCTVPSYPQNPISPGNSSSIKVVFNTKSKMPGPQKATVTVTSNSGNPVAQLTMKGDVILAKE